MKLWIGRDEEGDLWLYNRELEKKFGGFIPKDDNCDIMEIDNDLFPEVTFENSTQQVEESQKTWRMDGFVGKR